MNNELQQDHLIIQGDCIEIMNILIDLGIKVDLILTDPPYQQTNNEWDTIIPYDKLWDCLARIRKDIYTPILLFADEPFASDLYNSNRKWYRYRWYWNKRASTGFLNASWQPMKVIEEILVFLETPYKQLPSQEIWKKHDHIAQFYPQYERGQMNHSTGNKLAGKTSKNYGNFKTQNEINLLIKEVPNKAGTTYWSEPIRKHHSDNYGNSKGPSRLFQVPPQLNEVRTDLVNKGINDKHPKNLITFQKQRGFTKTEQHPTEKPVDLLEYLVKTYSKEGDLILDFTAGSGSLMEACLNTNRRSISIELSPKYINMIEQRYERIHWLKELEKD